jgi:hypothetical protein
VTRGIKSMKDLRDLIGNQTRNLPACSAVTQTTASSRTPTIMSGSLEAGGMYTVL